MVGKHVPSEEINGDLQEEAILNCRMQLLSYLFVSRNSDYRIIKASSTIYLSLFVLVISMRNQLFTLLIEIL